MARYLKYTWIIVIPVLIINGLYYLLLDPANLTTASARIALVVRYGLFIALVLGMQGLVAKKVEKDESIKNVVFFELVPVFFINIIAGIIDALHSNMEAAGTTANKVIVWASFLPGGAIGILIGFAVYGFILLEVLKMALKRQGKYQDHADDKFFGESRLVGIVLTVILFIGVIGMLISPMIASHFTAADSDKAEKEIDSLSSKPEYADMYGGVTSPYFKYDNLQKINEVEGKDSLPLVLMITRPADEQYMEKVREIANKNQVELYVMPAKYTYNHLKDLEKEYDKKVQDYIHNHPDTIIKDTYMSPTPALELNVGENAIVLEPRADGELAEYQKILGNPGELKYPDEKELQPLE